ncbi:MAG: cytochrome c oxidase subunit 3 [Candidatus Thermoplasmatota archaeon]|nr:cytochrome c oxidase subunit 3 [Candidatus Thermoplasmatota archaeon]
MGGAGGSDVKNAVWMRALVMAGMILGLSIAAYVGLGVIAADMKHQTWTDEKADYAEAKNAYDEAVEADNNVTDNLKSPIYVDYANAYNDKVDAHLSYLTYRVAGLAILFVGIIFTAFLVISGILNSSRPDEDHDNHHGHDEHEHHGSASPIIFSFGCLLFLLGFPDFADALHGLMMGSAKGTIGDMSVSMIGLTVVTIGVANWWREDLPFNGYGEQLATSDPFNGQHIRKAGIWVFLMSEVMVFATFFSSYLRMRTEWCTKWAFDKGTCREVDLNGDGEFDVFASHDLHPDYVLTASDYLRPGGAMVDKFGESVGDFWTMLPGAVNTFALIISSYTIVLALKVAKSHDYKAPSGFMGKLMPTKKAAIRNYLIVTLLLGTMFIILKLVEWSHLIAEGFTFSGAGETASIFYVATGAHGVHVFAGLLIMLYMIFKAETVEWNEDNAQGIEYFGLYWHFVDLAWVVIFPAFYLY